MRNLASACEAADRSQRAATEYRLQTGELAVDPVVARCAAAAGLAPSMNGAASAVVAAPIIFRCGCTRHAVKSIGLTATTRSLQNEAQKSIARLQRRLGRRVFHHRR